MSPVAYLADRSDAHTRGTRNKPISTVHLVEYDGQKPRLCAQTSVDARSRRPDVFRNMRNVDPEVNAGARCTRCPKPGDCELCGTGTVK